MKHAIVAALLTLLCTAASAKVVGVITSGAGKIVLHDEQGQCVGEALKAEFIPTSGATIPGCWQPIQGGAQIVFMDADAVRVPTQAIKRGDV